MKVFFLFFFILPERLRRQLCRLLGADSNRPVLLRCSSWPTHPLSVKASRGSTQNAHTKDHVRCVMVTSERVLQVFKMLLKFGQIFHRRFFILFIFSFPSLTKSISLHCSTVICTNTVVGFYRIWFLGLWIIRQGECMLQRGWTAGAAPRSATWMNNTLHFRGNTLSSMNTDHQTVWAHGGLVKSLWSSDFVHAVGWFVLFLFATCHQYNSLTIKGQQRLWDGQSDSADHTLHTPPLWPFSYTLIIWTHEHCSKTCNTFTK